MVFAVSEKTLLEEGDSDRNSTVAMTRLLSFKSHSSTRGASSSLVDKDTTSVLSTVDKIVIIGCVVGFYFEVNPFLTKTLLN